MSSAIAGIRVVKVAGNIGAEVGGVKVGPDLHGSVVTAIRDALLEHRVLFFREQHHLDDESQVGFARLFGEVELDPRQRGTGPGGQLIELDSHFGGKAAAWHTDATYTDRPPAITMLRTVLLPPYGGDTTWANTAAAYRNLDPELRELADRLRVLHSTEHLDRRRRAVREARRAAAGEPPVPEARRPSFTAEHPVVRLHPETGERALVLGAFAMRILDTDDSDAMIEQFQRRVTQLENTVRWQWALGDVAMWDNRATQHYAIHDYGDHRRKIRRCVIAGDVPVGVDGRASVAHGASA